MSSAQTTTAGIGEANAATVRRLCDAANTGDVAVISRALEEACAADVVSSPPPPVPGTGLEALQQVWATLLAAFPDLHVAIEDLIVEGDKVVVRNVVTGTNRGPYRGRPATGRPVHYGEIFIFRFADGRVVEAWGVVDLLTQLRQLDALDVNAGGAA